MAIQKKPPSSGSTAIRYSTIPPQDPVQVISGDVDIEYADSLDVSDALAGTLGPIQTQDSFDLADELASGPLVLADSVDLADALRAITDLVVADSIDFNDALSGTLGPIQTQDSIDFADTLVGDALVLQDSIDISDVPKANWTMDAQAVDSIDLSDAFGQILQVSDDSLTISDSFAALDLQANDSFDMSDAAGDLSLSDLQDSFDLSDSSDVLLISDAPDSIDFADVLPAIDLVFADSIDMNDAQGSISVADALLWPNVNVSNSGWTLTTNMTDQDINSDSRLAATSSGLAGTGGTQNSTTGTSVYSLPDVNWDILQVTAAVLEWRIAADQSGVPLTAGQANIDYQYSVDEGLNWTTFFAQTNLVGSTSTLDVTAVIADTLSKINQFRVRATGTVLSGTGLLPVTTTARWYYARLRLTLAGPV